MSIDLVSACLWLDLPPARKLVLLSLCERARLDDGLCWPGRTEIAMRSSLSEKSVTTHMRELEQEGWIRSGPNPKSAGKTTHRWVNTKKVLASGLSRQSRALTILGEESSPSSETSRGSSRTDLGELRDDLGEVDADLGEAASPVTVIEPSLEPSREPSAAAAAVKFWEEATAQTLAPVTAEMIASAGEKYGIETFKDAVKEAAASATALRWNYVAAILRRWESEGRGAKPLRTAAGGATADGRDPWGTEEERKVRFAGGRWGHLAKTS